MILGHLGDTLWTEGAFGINDSNLALGASLRLWFLRNVRAIKLLVEKDTDLSDDTHGVGELRLSTTILAIHLVDTARFEASTEDGVPLLAAGRDTEAALASNEQLLSRHHTSESMWL